MKNEVKTFHFEDHIRTWTVISKKKKKKKKQKRSSPCFPLSVRPAASTVFPNLALREKSLFTSDVADHAVEVTSKLPELLFRVYENSVLVKTGSENNVHVKTFSNPGLGKRQPAGCMRPAGTYRNINS